MRYSVSPKRKACLRRFYTKRAENKKCKRCGQPAELNKTHCRSCTDKLSRAHSERCRNYRYKIIQGYGGKCAWCGETIKEFLAIDHKTYRACEEKEKKFGRMLFIAELCKIIERENFPDTYQILCHNCNMSLGSYGYCPHHPEIRRPLGHRKG